MKKTSIFGSALLLIFVLTLGYGCDFLDEDEDEAKVDCTEAFCLGTILSDNEDFNRHLIEAVELAKEDINKAGGNTEIIDGNSFAPGDPEPGEPGSAGVTQSARMLQEMGVHGLVGPAYSSESLDVFGFVNEEGIATISPSATSPAITDENKKAVDMEKKLFFLRMAPSDRFQAPIMAQQAHGNVVIVHRDDAWGNALAELAEKEINESQGKAVLGEPVKYPEEFPGAQSVVSMVEAIPGIENANSIIVLAFSEGEDLIRGLLDSDVIPDGIRYCVGDGFALREIFPLTAKQGSAVSEFRSVTASSAPGDRLTEFKERFSEDAATVSDFAAHAYDAAVVLRLAALSAESNDPSDYVSEITKVTEGGYTCSSYATCAAALTDDNSTNDDINYEGVSGPVDLDSYGDVTKAFYAVYTYDAEGEETAKKIFDLDGNEQQQ